MGTAKNISKTVIMPPTISIKQYGAKLGAVARAVKNMTTKEFLRKMKTNKNFANLANVTCGSGRVRSKKTKRCVWDAETKHDKLRKWAINMRR